VGTGGRRLRVRHGKQDALHIACPIAGECAYFITTDDDILKRRQDVHDITVIDPTACVREMNL
jgi:predicted nucleic acid-binding protein